MATVTAINLCLLAAAAWFVSARPVVQALRLRHCAFGSEPAKVTCAFMA